MLGTEDNPYDATKSGPLCPQLGLEQEMFDHYLVKKFKVLLLKVMSLFLAHECGRCIKGAAE